MFTIYLGWPIVIFKWREGILTHEQKTRALSLIRRELAINSEAEFFDAMLARPQLHRLLKPLGISIYDWFKELLQAKIAECSSLQNLAEELGLDVTLLEKTIRYKKLIDQIFEYKGMSAKELSTELKVSLPIIYKACKEGGIQLVQGPKGRPKKKERNQALVDDRSNGLSLSKLADKYEIGVSAVCKILRQEKGK